MLSICWDFINTNVHFRFSGIGYSFLVTEFAEVEARDEFVDLTLRLENGDILSLEILGFLHTSADHQNDRFFFHSESLF